MAHENNDIELILIGPRACGKSTLAKELKDVLLRYGVKSVVSFHYKDEVSNEDGWVEWDIST